MDMLAILVWLVGGVLAYLLGSIPFGYLMAKAHGKDIRTLGSGNIGATNVFRSIGKTQGIITFLLDFLKGAAGVWLIPGLALSLFGTGVTANVTRYLPLFCGVMTVFGHNWTCFLGFKGGKGIATSAGMLLALAPVAVGIAFSVWVVLFLLTRYVSVASIGAAAVLAVEVWILPSCVRQGIVLQVVLTALAVLAIAKHHANIGRLVAGTESRFTFKKRK